MSTYSLVIVDDEQDAITTLEKFLGKYCPHINIIGSAYSVESALALLAETEPDILLLDIRMADGSGFNVLEKYQSIKTKTIFTTAYNNFAIDAFKVRAIDYLLKPINPLQLKEAISIATEQIRLKNALNELNSLLAQQESEKIALPAKDGKYVTAINDIVRLEAEVNYCHVFLADNTSILSAKTMKVYESLLQESFVRVHQSHLVNIRWISKFITAESMLELKDGALIPVSRRRRTEVQELLNTL